ncbi:hypothetical protein [Wenzhouxiangella sp. XN24]|uniref:hypothetical protein n=1 Tax=Wenzhouxiangella sp. XN24 TaxID=2713569 RepID=UPI0013EA9CE5|nr:hypothetical protein [Wenzhouxiangella sp. XN24]NGX17194.1 hypothetical protein [Wenzhouxiangella sp. XN24]
MQNEAPTQSDGNDRPSDHELARLRDRTDELELIISSLTTVALFTLPGWLFERYAESYTHLSVTLVVSGGAVVPVLTGLSYGLGACFLLHLLARAYWVGLIGLRAVFPQGIDWNRTVGVGPLSRERYRQKLPDLQTAIKRSDRFASSLFAVISVIAIAIIWFAMLLTVTAATGGLVGGQFGATNQGIIYASLGLLIIAGGTTLLRWLMDAVLAARIPALRRAGWFRWLVGALGHVNSWLIPQRLVLPVRLTLQSNTRPVIFSFLLVLGVIFIIIIGQVSFQRSAEFTVSDQFEYLNEDHFDGPLFRSSYYEDMRTGKDRLRGRPIIPTFEQRSSHVRVFLPYQPLRDNLLLEQLCPGEDAALGAACLGRLWSVQLNGEAVDIKEFIASERLDLGMRGLLAVVPLEGLSPGLQLLTVIWNPQAGAEDRPVDDRYDSARFEYRIPFLFSPDFERPLEAPAP